MRDVRSIIFWGIILPLVILGLAWATRGLSLVLGLAYPLQVLRIAHRHRIAGMSPRDAWLYGWSCTLARFPHALGLLRYWIGRALGWNKRIIEYKSPTKRTPEPA